MSKIEKVKRKKPSVKPYVRLPCQNSQQKDIAVADLERLVKENFGKAPPNQLRDNTHATAVVQGTVLPKCPIHLSDLTPFTATNSGERFFRCPSSQCGVICFENNLMDYSQAVAGRLHISFKTAAPVCQCGNTTLLNVSKSQKNFMRPYFTCGQRDKQDRCKYFQWADQKITNKNLQISNAVVKSRMEREAEIQNFLKEQQQAVAPQEEIPQGLLEMVQEMDIAL